MRKAFTLIELLIVIAIIGILAVTVLLALNPAEAQKKSRDANRVKDATTLQAALEQLIDSGVVIPSAANEIGHANGAVSSSGFDEGDGNLTNNGLKAQNCTNGTHWMGPIDLCTYIKTVPLDPNNGSPRTVANGAGADSTDTVAVPAMRYKAVIAGSDYEINVRQESTSNWQKVASDGGNADSWFEIFSGNNALFDNSN